MDHEYLIKRVVTIMKFHETKVDLGLFYILLYGMAWTHTPHNTF